MPTEIQPVPDAVLASEFPSLADRAANLYNQKAKNWADSENAMAERTREIALTAHNNATVATEQAVIATTKAGEASNSAQAAADSKTAAQEYADNLADLDELWLGAATSDPTTGKGGAPLVAGNAYVNSVTGYLRAYDGSAWQQGISAVAGVSSINGMTGAVTFSPISIEGDTQTYVTLQETYTITNYNSFSDYVVQVSDGTVSLAGDTITFNAPATDGTVTMTLTVDGVATPFSIEVLPASALPPTLTVQGGPDAVPETPTLTASAFESAPSGDTHASTDWRAKRVSDGAVVWSSIGDTVNKTSITVPAGNLVISEEYDFDVQYNATASASSGWVTVRATTKDDFNDYIETPAATPASFGSAFEGGFYAGLVWNQLVQSSTSTAIGTGTKTFTVPDMAASHIVYGGQELEIRSRANPSNKMVGTVTGAVGTTLTINVTSVGGSGTFSDWSIMSRYRLIVAPKSSGENAGIAMKNANTALPTACQTLTEGWLATEAMKNADTSTVYPAAHWARGLSIGGFNDWFIPARDQLELCWRNLKPTTDNNYTTANRPTAAAYNYANLGSYGDTSAEYGVNNNSAPTGSAYTASVPARTSVAAFQTGGAEAFEYGSVYYWSSSDYDASVAWSQDWNSSFPGRQSNNFKTSTARVRAVRRSII